MARRVLVVDDDIPTVQLIRAALGQEGYEVSAAHDGASALLAIAKERPDLVLLDVVMPVMDGFHTLSALRADPKTQELPVLMLTARDDDIAVARGWREGVDMYLTKPFEVSTVVAAVKRMLEG
ncbi:MAG: PleD family two-component system response regulator [Armatimonadota bacterium]